ncbi:MAG: toll/interleukin-1 receptor domain-containing protein [Phycisphaerae bacterium]|nr:toll/interleukin-1 receptor domain-containing protein [Phycisphaerae bacterium]
MLWVCDEGDSAANLSDYLDSYPIQHKGRKGLNCTPVGGSYWTSMWFESLYETARAVGLGAFQGRQPSQFEEIGATCYRRIEENICEASILALQFLQQNAEERLRRLETAQEPQPNMRVGGGPEGQSTLGQTRDGTTEWDVFISHASEDKEAFVRPLAEALQKKNLRVWFDEFTLTVGDSLRRSIDNGLARSRYGVVVISPDFLKKEWPQRELDGLFAQEGDGRKKILPVWHNVVAETVRQYSPLLAGRLATLSTQGVDGVVEDLVRAMSC